MKALLAQGKVPWNVELEQHPEKAIESYPYPMGQVAGIIHEILPAKTIVENMIRDAANIMQKSATLVRLDAKL